jgi:hypothetical protein
MAKLTILVVVLLSLIAFGTIQLSNLALHSHQQPSDKRAICFFSFFRPSLFPSEILPPLNYIVALSIRVGEFVNITFRIIPEETADG